MYDNVIENYHNVLSRIEAAAQKSGQSAKDIKLVAVTKTVPPDVINAVIAEGAAIIGENRVQELCSKLPQLNLASAEVHLIGRLQTNKVKYIIDKVSLVQSVDSLRLAQQIEKEAAKRNLTANVLVEVNIGGEEQKGGVAPEELESLFESISQLKHVKVKGLMTVPPLTHDRALLTRYFSDMFKLFIDMKGKKMDNISMDILSMGMSADFDIAVECGSNMVRVGSAIFGRRN